MSSTTSERTATLTCNARLAGLRVDKYPGSAGCFCRPLRSLFQEILQITFATNDGHDADRPQIRLINNQKWVQRKKNTGREVSS